MDATWYVDAREHPLQVYQISAQWVEAFSIRKLLKFVKSSPEENTDDLLARLLLQSIT